MSELLLRAGAWEAITPEDAGWRWLSFEVVDVPAGGDLRRRNADEEVAVVVQGGRCSIESGGERWDLGDRADVFAGMPWSLYLPVGSEWALRSADGARVAICGARCGRRHPARLIPPSEVAIEVRGAGNATRQINHIIPPEFPCERLLVVEVFTPAGNWSSYPPHKHDEDRPPGEVVLEEVYHFRTSAPEGFAMQRLYTADRSLDLTAGVGDGDLLLVPHGYHTTCAAHGYDLYYLNALAGERRSMAAADDPAHAWIRATWDGMPTDPRVPLVGRDGG